jgi:hypothetical protein
VPIRYSPCSLAHSVEDSGYLSRNPAPNFFHPGSKNLSILTPKNMIRVVHFLTIPDPGSRGQKGTGPRIRIRYTASSYGKRSNCLTKLLNFSSGGLQQWDSRGKYVKPLFCPIKIIWEKCFCQISLSFCFKKVMKTSQNSRNQDFSSFFCLFMEESVSVQINCGSGCGSRRAKNRRRIRIRIRKTGKNSGTHLLLLFRCAVEQLELVEVDPGVPQVGVQLHRAQEPVARLLQLTLRPEQPAQRALTGVNRQYSSVQ